MTGSLGADRSNSGHKHIHACSHQGRAAPGARILAGLPNRKQAQANLDRNGFIVRTRTKLLHNAVEILMTHQIQTLLEISVCHTRVTTRLGNKAGPGQSCHINKPDHIQRNPGNHPRSLWSVCAGESLQSQQGNCLQKLLVLVLKQQLVRKSFKPFNYE